MMLSTSFTMSSPSQQRDQVELLRSTPRQGRYSLGDNRSWTPSYSDCDKIIEDIYSLTASAKTRKRHGDLLGLEDGGGEEGVRQQQK